MLRARLRRWLHCMGWLMVPWRWDSKGHMQVTVYSSKQTTIACSCGVEFGRS